eukprot:CAMPEP_0194059448 /NCGR_PEP_ID=MMETSP0009_2-20130614/69053_1 /TAXON_ID=210454 /ORGANISM="Grammatophora oceanica, Strain CCMP 410" /LENGTH=90 /DNA_ID=CAMNT_0038710005 /DNA_START=290 /DNA_END=558 /DNA_ORIENTATION=+
MSISIAVVDVNTKPMVNREKMVSTNDLVLKRITAEAAAKAIAAALYALTASDRWCRTTRSPQMFDKEGVFGQVVYEGFMLGITCAFNNLL